MKPGDLVRVRWGGTANPQTALGTVTGYLPDRLGGTSVCSWRGRDGVSHPEIISTPRRGEVAVMIYDDGSHSLYDELNVELLEGDPECS
jgi:hypothetical protein